MKFLLISLGLVTLAVQVFCQEAAAPTEVGETDQVPAGTSSNQVQAVQEPAQTEERKLTKRSHGWGWPEYSYGWPWPGWYGYGYGGHGSYGGHGGGWYPGWYGGHGWPVWYGGHGSGWHSKW